jgi:predicted nucleic acid-binding protein
MPRLVAALDADVLVPILSCDFLLTAFESGLYEPVVSTEVIAEVERNLIENFPHVDPASVRRRVGQMREALEDQLVDVGSADNVDEAINPKDRHVIAAALTGEASLVVTNDKRLRAETESADVGLVALSADAFAAHLWELMPDDVDEVVNVLVSKRTKRPVTAQELMEALRGPFPAMAAAWFAASRD